MKTEKEIDEEINNLKKMKKENREIIHIWN